MKITTQSNGDVILQVKGVIDWTLLKSIVIDTLTSPIKLANQLANVLRLPEIAQDWEDFVVPDLQQNFEDDINVVYCAVDHACKQVNEKAGRVVIRPSDRRAWYSVLNQAQFALETIYQFSSCSIDEILDGKKGEETRIALVRSNDYHILQTVLLDLGLD